MVQDTTQTDEPAVGERSSYKKCAHCGEQRSVREFRRRTGRKSGPASRRGACRECRKRKTAAEDGAVSSSASAPRSASASAAVKPERAPKPVLKRPLPTPPVRAAGPDASELRPDRTGVVRMRGRTEKGKRWLQETDLETAVVLVREHAAVVVNRHTIRRLYSNKAFRNYILARDQYTCYFCGEPGDTIDHLVPRAKGGHTTPVNCVVACQACNQSKADRHLADFLEQNDDLNL